MSEQGAPGARLKAEREQRGLSAQKAADEMHLDAWVIDALEAGDYARIGPTVYAKGHLKKYAALLGLPVAEILADFTAPPPAATAAPSKLLAARAEAPAQSHLSPLRFAGAAFAVAMLIGLLWWRPWQQRGAAAMSAGSAGASVAASTSTVAAASTGTIAAAGASDDATPGDRAPTPGPALERRPAAVDAAAVPPDAAAAPPGSGPARLRLSFSADSWVDVRDAAGNRAYAGNGQANSVKTIAGLAPMRVYLGFGSGVQLAINDHVVAIGPQYFAGDVARFEVGADGVLRHEPRGDASRPAPARGTVPAAPGVPGTAASRSAQTRPTG